MPERVRSSARLGTVRGDPVPRRSTTEGDRTWFERMIDEELVKIQELTADSLDTARYGQAVALFTEVALADSFAEFLTLPACVRMP